MNTIKKAHFQLTLLNGCITTLILVIMTLGYLFISENNMMKNKIYSYQSDIYTIASYIEQQDIITNTWLSQLESGKKYYVSLIDNDTEFLYDINTVQKNKERKQVLEQAWNYYQTENSSNTPHTLSYKSSYVSFILEYKNNTNVTFSNYCCFVIHMQKNTSNLKILLAAPLENLQNQMLKQRFLFLGIITLALIAIWIFAWIFTGKLLNPIETSRLQQNQFIASASHELRTPLAVILSCAEIGLGKNACSELATIKNEALRTSRLLNDMLTLLSCDTGHLDIKLVRAQLDTLILNACESFEYMAAAKHIKISASLPEDPLPDCICDSDRIIQVLTIFLHNAISYTPEGGIINLSIAYQNKHFEIKISDTGIGISNEEKIKIFDRFYRSEKARSDKNHFGLGLSIAYDIITVHHGNIKVTDTPGGGTTFVITLRSQPTSKYTF